MAKKKKLKREKQDNFLLLAGILVGVFWLFLFFTFLGQIQNADKFESSSRGYEMLVFGPEGLDYLGNNLQKSYNGGDTIKGTINLSLSDIDANSILTSNFLGNISLLSLLEMNNLVKGTDYDCNTQGCEELYSPTNAVSSFQLDNEEILGFSISGNDITDINKVQFRVQSDVEPASQNQLSIDMLNNGQDLLINTNTDGDVYFYVYNGCYDNSAQTQLATIITSPYCENMTLPFAPGFELSANIVKSTQTNVPLKMELRDTFSGDIYGACDLPVVNQSQQELKCVVNFTGNEIRQYLVCIRAGESGGNHKIKTETSGGVCGTDEFGNPSGLDYDLHARILKFGEVETFIDNSEFQEQTGNDLNFYIEDYIFGIFNGNCLPNCIIPVRFKGFDQEVTISDVVLEYKQGITLKETNDIYNVELETPVIDSQEIEIELEPAGFEIPINSQSNHFKLYINGQNIFTEDISVSGGIDFDLFPLTVGFGQDTRFIINSNTKIVKSDWSFGDGTTRSVESFAVNHRYLEQGDVELTVTAHTESGKKASKSFTIRVGSAKEIANSTLFDFKSNINPLKNKIGKLPSWIGNKINDEIDFITLESVLSQLQDDYDAAETDEDYQKVMLSLLELEFPSDVVSLNGLDDVPLIVGAEKMDISFLEEIGGIDAEDRNAVKQNIVAYMDNYYKSKIQYEQIVVRREGGNDYVLSVFEIEIESLDDSGVLDYLVIGQNIENDGKYKEEYGVLEIGGAGSYLTRDDPSLTNIEFFLIGEYTPEDLGAYIAPSIDRLDVTDQGTSPCNFNNICEEDIGEDEDNCPADCGVGRWGWFTLWIIALLFIALIVYILLQEWYKKYYQTHLFSNRTDLYNLINFIYNARKSGHTSREIRSKLKDVNWKGEQISYAFKKIDGKRVGLYELPVFKFVENRKVKKEIERRHGGSVDKRFVMNKKLS